MTQEIPAPVRALADRRVQARVEKDFAGSDALREEIAELGWAVRDTVERFEASAEVLMGKGAKPALTGADAAEAPPKNPRDVLQRSNASPSNPTTL